MGKVIIDISMSVDGFVTGLNDGKGNGMGDGGMVLFDWVFKGTDEEKRFLEDPDNTLGGCVLGRRTFDIAGDAWGDKPPFGDATVFVLTHRQHESLTRGKVTFHFVTDGLDSAMSQAKAAAGDRDVALMGASVSQQALKAGMVDEMMLHIGNVLL
ncbi:MAG TPA: dihydrofolate reductase family protein, partial [Tepidisphaeraceae bacterium]|nr:dihydrofolate reductase family protein [Tepidisphaeraceae bacterium]